MKSYWLSIDEGGAVGPYVESQLLTMWRNGQFTKNDLLCEEGKKKWYTAGSVMRVMEKAEVARAPQPKQNSSGCGAVFLLVVVAIIVIFAVQDDDSPTAKAISPNVTLNSWAARAFADPNVEVMRIGDPMVWDSGSVLMIVTVRGKNKFGGPVINQVMVKMNRPMNAVIYSWTLKEWMDIYGEKASPEIRLTVESAIRFGP